jgi:hypothetical protein
MTNAINKAEVEKALMNAIQPGMNTVREVDKVMARIHKGEFDLDSAEGQVGTTSDLDGLEPTEASSDATLITDAMERWVRAMYPGHVIRDWAAGVDLVLIDDDEPSPDQVGMPSRTVYITNPFGGLAAELGILQIAAGALKEHALRVTMSDQ